MKKSTYQFLEDIKKEQDLESAIIKSKHILDNHYKILISLENGVNRYGHSFEEIEKDYKDIIRWQVDNKCSIVWRVKQRTESKGV